MLAFAIALALSGCAVRPPLVTSTPAEYAAARARFAENALETWTQRELRLQAVGVRLFSAMAAQCNSSTVALPIVIQTVDAIPRRLRVEVQDAGLAGQFPRVFLLNAQETAEQRTALSGIVVTAVDGVSVESIERLQWRRLAQRQSAVLRVRNADGSAADVTVSASARCDPGLELTDSDSFGAFYGFGTIKVNAGTLDVVNDDQLAFVIAHELAHHELRHQQERLARAAAGFAADTALGLPGLFTAVGGLAFWQPFERAADQYALRSVATAGFDAARASTIWQDVAHALPQKIGPRLLLKTHPRVADRDEDLRRLYAEMHGRGEGRLGSAKAR